MLLGFEKTQKLLNNYKIPYAKSKIVKSKKELFGLAYPLALKVSDILHKADVGGVILNIENKRELLGAYKKISSISKDVIAQEMIKGEKIIMGARKDPVFGPVLLFGLGGIFVEILKDISFRLAPVSKKEAREMIQEIKGHPVLRGVRGRKGVRIDDLERMIVNLSDLIVKENIKEIDLNPVIANPKQTIVVDAKIIV